MPALQFSRDLDCQYRTAFVLARKLREAMAAEQADAKLSGTVEMDGACFGGYVRPKNRKEDRKDRRLSENQNGKRRVVMALRQRQGRTLPLVFERESESLPTILARVEPGSTILADEASSGVDLHGWYEMGRVNHSVAFMDNGVCTNQAESLLAACAGPRLASTTTSAAGISSATPARWRGARITAASPTGRSSRWCWLRR